MPDLSSSMELSTAPEALRDELEGAWERGGNELTSCQHMLQHPSRLKSFSRNLHRPNWQRTPLARGILVPSVVRSTGH